MTRPRSRPSNKCNVRRGLAAALVTLGLSFAPGAQAAPVFADWVAGSVDGITVNVTETATSGAFSRAPGTATDANFVASYGAVFSTLIFGATGSPANLLAEIVFSQALPTGSMLFAIDLDFSDETFAISSNLGFLTLLDQGETTSGQNSALPSYDSTTGLLVETVSGNNGNFDEYSRFDVSGVTSMSVQFLNGGFSSGSRIAVATPGNMSTIPLPAGLPLILTGLAGLGLLARRKNRRQNSACH